MDQSLTARDTNYQLEQSKIAVGAGGVVGAGLMKGRQKLLYLPEAHTDFIYAVVGEELGLVGSVGLLVGFRVILWRGLRAALRMRDDFGRYLALGITDGGGGAGVDEHERGAGHDADQGDSAADDQLRRQFAAVHAGVVGDFDECVGARGLGSAPLWRASLAGVRGRGTGGR